jgi:hypothetical protein
VAFLAPRYFSRRSACARATLRRSEEISGPRAFAAGFFAAFAEAFLAAVFAFAADFFFTFAAIAHL